MPEYYYYLVRTTWPGLLVLFFVLFIIGVKAAEVSLKARRSGRGWRTLPLWLIKMLGWSGIFGIYLLMFLPANPDWIARPALSSGTIAELRPLEQGKVLILLAAAAEGSGKDEPAAEGSGKVAPAEKSSGEVSAYLTLYADSQFSLKVRVGDMVEFTYLPHKKEIVKCQSL